LAGVAIAYGWKNFAAFVGHLSGSFGLDSPAGFLYKRAFIPGFSDARHTGAAHQG